MTHDFRSSPDGDDADRFMRWLEAETTDGLRRAHGDAAATKAAIFLFVNRAFESHMPEPAIGQLFGKCVVRAGISAQDEEAAFEWLQVFGDLARTVHHDRPSSTRADSPE